MNLLASDLKFYSSVETIPIYEMGSESPVGIARGKISYKINCEFIPVFDDGEDVESVLSLLREWLSGNRVNFVKATELPRCFYCGTLNKRMTEKCSQCGGEMK